MSIQTYLFFNGNCQSAIELYTQVFGAQVTFLMRFKEGPAQLRRPGNEELIFHATLQIGETSLNMSDAPSAKFEKPAGFALLIHLESIEAAERVFAELQTGGHVHLPLTETFWAKRYGNVIDRFGVMWKIQVNKEA